MLSTHNIKHRGYDTQKSCNNCNAIGPSKYGTFFFSVSMPECQLNKNKYSHIHFFFWLRGSKAPGGVNKNFGSGLFEDERVSFTAAKVQILFELTKCLYLKIVKRPEI